MERDNANAALAGRLVAAQACLEHHTATLSQMATVEATIATLLASAQQALSEVDQAIATARSRLSEFAASRQACADAAWVLDAEPEASSGAPVVRPYRSVARRA